MNQTSFPTSLTVLTPITHMGQKTSMLFLYSNYSVEKHNKKNELLTLTYHDVPSTHFSPVFHSIINYQLKETICMCE